MRPLDTTDPVGLPLAARRQRHLPAGAALDWLAAGWRDLWQVPLPSLSYGLMVFVVSILVVWGLFAFQLDAILFPALAGFMVAGPLIAIGLYQKSRDLEEGREPSLSRMVFVRAESGGQIWFTGAILCLLIMVWIRAAAIIYALFFGLRPLPGVGATVALLLTTWEGWGLTIVGTAVGGLFAAFAFAISTFAVPMLLAEKTDAFTAMGTSMSIVWNNLPVMLAFGAIVAVLTGLSLATGLAGLIVVFPLMGHATWHGYRALR